MTWRHKWWQSLHYRSRQADCPCYRKGCLKVQFARTERCCHTAHRISFTITYYLTSFIFHLLSLLVKEHLCTCFIPSRGRLLTRMISQEKGTTSKIKFLTTIFSAIRISKESSLWTNPFLRNSNLQPTKLLDTLNDYACIYIYKDIYFKIQISISKY